VHHKKDKQHSQLTPHVYLRPSSYASVSNRSYILCDFMRNHVHAHDHAHVHVFLCLYPCEFLACPVVSRTVVECPL
jgi:hypothetical protein